MHMYKQLLNDECVHPIISVTISHCTVAPRKIFQYMTATIIHLRLLVYMVLAMTEGAQL